jgi:hypothetical protein
LAFFRPEYGDIRFLAAVQLVIGNAPVQVAICQHELSTDQIAEMGPHDPRLVVHGQQHCVLHGKYNATDRIVRDQFFDRILFQTIGDAVQFRCMSRPTIVRIGLSKIGDEMEPAQIPADRLGNIVDTMGHHLFSS